MKKNKNLMVKEQSVPVLTIYEVEREKVFQELLTKLEKRKEEQKVFGVENVVEAIQLQALLSYTWDVPALAKRLGCKVKLLEELKSIDYSNFFDNVFKSKSDESLARTFGIEEKADEKILKGLDIENLSGLALPAAHISKMMFEKRIKKEEIAIKRKEAEKANSTVNVNVQYGDAELNSRIADLEKRIAFTEGREVKTITEAEVLNESTIPI